VYFVRAKVLNNNLAFQDCAVKLRLKSTKQCQAPKKMKSEPWKGLLEKYLPKIRCLILPVESEPSAIPIALCLMNLFYT
jgi:hypothetical protein